MATATNVSAWSTTPASNDGADSTIGTVANTSSPTNVDDWVRGVMAAVKKYVLDTDGGLTSGGTANAQTLTTNRQISSGHQAAGFSLRFKAGATNTGATTLNVDSLGAVAIKRLNGDALSAGDIVSGGIYDVSFDGTNYILMGAGTGSGTYGTLSGNNSWSGAQQFSGNVTIGPGAFAANGSATLGNDSSDAVVIKGTTVNSFMSGLFSSANASALYTAIGTVPVANGGTASTTAATGARTLLNGLGTTKGHVLYYDGSNWTVLAPAGGTSVSTMQWRRTDAAGDPNIYALTYTKV